MADRLTRIIEVGPISVLSVCQARVEDVAIWREWSVSKDSSIKEALLRLAAYEDTGLTPEEVAHAKDLLAAEQDGRLVTLPCKVGDTVWVRDRDGRPREMILDAPDIRCHCAKEDEVCMALCGSKNTGVCAYRLKNDGSDIGKTVFLTRAEAEKAPEKEAQS